MPEMRRREGKKKEGKRTRRQAAASKRTVTHLVCSILGMHMKF